MYQSLYNYAQSRELIANPRKENRLISAHIVISEKGEYLRTEMPNEPKTKTPCPSVGSLYAISSGKIRYACPICDKISSIFYGVVNAENEIQGDEKKYEAWKQIMKEAAEADQSLIPLNMFIANADTDVSIRQKIYDELISLKLKNENWVSFAVVDEDGIQRNLENSDTWEKWFDEWMSERETKNTTDGQIISVITGKPVIPVATAPFPKIMTSQTGQGAYIGSFGQAALQSYGYTDNRSLQMSFEEAYRLKAAIEDLLSSEYNHSDYFGIVYWFERRDPDAERAVSAYFKAKKQEDNGKKAKKKRKTAETAYTKAMTDPYKGKPELKSSEKGNVFHTINFTVSSPGRAYFSNERKETYDMLFNAVKQWDRDTSIEAPLFEDDTDHLTEDGTPKKKVVGYTIQNIGNASAILLALINNEKTSNKYKQAEKEFGAERARLFGSVCFGDDIPEIFYKRAIRMTTKQMSISGKQSSSTTLKLIKAYLIRNGGMDMIKPDLNEDIREPAYLCGRWLAVVNKLQQDSADSKLNVTLSAKYYKALKNNPANTMSELNNLVRVYISRLQRRGNNGAAVYYEKKLAHLAELMGAKYPEKLTMKQQGMLDLGYYHQNNELFKKKDKADKANNAGEN